MRLGYGFDGQCLRQDDAELPLASRSILEQNYRSNAVGNAVIAVSALLTAVRIAIGYPYTSISVM